MKTIYATLLIAGLLSASSLLGQGRSKIGAFASIGGTTMWRTVMLDGGGGFSGSRSAEVGVNYYLQLGKRFEIESGIVMNDSEVKFTPGVLPPEFEQQSSYYDLKILYVPALARLNFGKYFFANAGFLFDFDLTPNDRMTRQSGVGFGGGFGGQIFVSEKLAINISHYLNQHRIVGFENEMYPELVFDTGIRLGLRMR